MITIHGSLDRSAERQAAEKLKRLAINFDSDIAASAGVVLDIFHSIQCFGQRPQDVDLIVLFADYRPTTKLFKTRAGLKVHSFCAVIEIKGHSPEDVVFEGSACSVIYNGSLHNVTSQNEGQKYSVKSYIEKQGKKSPWLISLIWLTRVGQGHMPRVTSNIVGSDVTWQKRGQVHLPPFGLSRDGRDAGLMPAKRWVLASTIARKSSRPKARCC